MFFPGRRGDYRSGFGASAIPIYRVRKTLFCGGNDDDTGRCDRGDSFGWVCGYDRYSYKDREKMNSYRSVCSDRSDFLITAACRCLLGGIC